MARNQAFSPNNSVVRFKVVVVAMAGTGMATRVSRSCTPVARRYGVFMTAPTLAIT